MAGIRWLETDTLSDRNISSALAIGVYTAAADRAIMCQALVAQAAGNGDYVMYVTLQVGGAGAIYVILPKTTMAAASGETAIAGQSGWINVRNLDVVTVYVDGLAGDTTTPDTIVRWFEDAALQPTTADMTLDVSATGEAGLDFNNIKAATGATTLTNITVPVVTGITNGVTISGTLGTLDALWVKVKKWLQLITRKDAAIKTDNAVELAEINVTGGSGAGAYDNLTDSQEAIKDNLPAAAPVMISAQQVRDAMLLAPTPPGTAIAGSIDKHLDDMPADVNTALSTAHGAGAWGGAGGSGAITWPYTLTDGISGAPIADAHVSVYAEAAMTTLLASGTTNAFGVVTFYLDAGTVYIKRVKTGYDFVNPDTEVVS